MNTLLKAKYLKLNSLLLNVFKAIRMSDKLDSKNKNLLLKIYHEDLCTVF